MPKVSVIIPNYNYARYFSQRIDSVLNQTYHDYEVIILDDCSTDNSREIIELYRTENRVSKIVYNEQNSGSPFKQWKKGIELAVGEYIWIAESDDWAQDNFLEKIMHLISSYPNVGICFSASNWIDEKNEIREEWSPFSSDCFVEGNQVIKHNLIYHNCIPNASAAVLKRSLALKNIDNVVNYKWCGDWLLYTYILMESNLIHKCEKLNSYRFYHENTSSKYSKIGFGIIEGIEVLGIVNFRSNEYNWSDIHKITKYWANKIQSLTGTKFKIVVLYKLFKFYVRFYKHSIEKYIFQIYK